MLTIKSDDVYGRSKAYESIIKGTEIVGPKVPESFNVLVKELQGLGLKVDLVTSDEVVDAENVLSANIKDVAAHQAEVEVPTPQIGTVDLSDDDTIEDFDIVEADSDLTADDSGAAAPADDDEDTALVTNDDAEEEA
jgi:DNA-directed RNA polymerase subunit beta